MKFRHFPLFVFVSLAADSAQAATYNWTNLNGGSWGTATNWENSSAPGVPALPIFVADDILDFSKLDITSDRTTTLDGNRTAGQLKFDDTDTGTGAYTHHWTVNPGIGGTLTLSKSAGTPTIDVDGTKFHMATINAGIAGSQGFTKTGSGQLALGGTNTYGGTTAISDGILTFAVPAAFQDNAVITAAAGTTLALRMATTGFTATDLDSLFAKTGRFSNVALNSAARVGIDTTNGDFEYSSNISGTFGLTKVGANKLTISGTNNTYTGGTFVSATNGVTTSVVDVSGNQSGATGGWDIKAGGTVNFLSGSTIVVTGAGKSITLANESVATHTLNVAGTVTVAADGINNTLAVRAGSVLNINSGAVWTQNGNMVIQSQSSFSTPIMNVNVGGSFIYAGSSVISLSSSSGTNIGSAILNISGGTFTTGKAFNNAGDSNHTSPGSANLTLSGGGTLKLSAGIASLVTTTGTTQTKVQLGTGGGVIDTNGFSTAIDLGITNISSQTGSLTKQNAGTLTLSGTNTYTGTTSVTGGTLLVNGTNTGSGLVSVSSGATLGGTGSVAGEIAVSGVLSPGATIESFSSGNLSLATGSTFRFEASGAGGTGADLMVVNGTLSLSNVTLDLSAANLGLGTWAVGDKLTLFSYNGTAITSGFTGYADDTNYVFGSNIWRINYNDSLKGNNYGSEATGNQFVTFTAVPEPATALLGSLGLLGLLRRRRK